MYVVHKYSKQQHIAVRQYRSNNTVAPHVPVLAQYVLTLRSTATAHAAVYTERCAHSYNMASKVHITCAE
eukprot:14142-Heterococcus_DN1.PRE.2